MAGECFPSQHGLVHLKSCHMIFKGGSNSKFNNLHFISSLETKETPKCAAEQSLLCVLLKRWLLK